MRRYEVQLDDGKPFGDGSVAACFDARTPRDAARLAIANDRTAKMIPDGAVLLVRLANSRRSSIHRYVVTGQVESCIG